MTHHLLILSSDPVRTMPVDKTHDHQVVKGGVSIGSYQVSRLVRVPRLTNCEAYLI